MIGVVPLLVAVVLCMGGCSAGTSAAGPLSIDAFWNNTAHFSFVSKARFPTTPGGEYGMNVGFHIVAQNGTWYLFHREYAFEPQPSYCKFDYARILVRTSTDEGRSWSNGSVVTQPIPNTAQECAIVDGAGYYDADANTWHYIGQCLDRTHRWMMCHYYRKSDSPLGPFTPNAANPVVKPGQLWSQICKNSGQCPTTMVDEGTPEIVLKDAQGYFYVTFHGWDAGNDVSARGIARTQDFVNWEVSGGLLPNAPIFTNQDCNHWNISWAQNKCVGGGEGTMLFSKQSNMFYHLIEAPDQSLGCLPADKNQNWVLGLLRSASFAASPGWQQPSAPISNPTVVPIVQQGCYIQYHRLFSDDNGVYLEFWADNWMQIFRLQPGSGARPIVAGPPPS